jgi:hypothetical protein
MPILIDNNDTGRPVYEQNIHNEELCMKCRFPQFHIIFEYDDGDIVDINKMYSCETKYINEECILRFIIDIASHKNYNNVHRFTKPEVFIQSIYNAISNSHHLYHLF